MSIIRVSPARALFAVILTQAVSAQTSTDFTEASFLNGAGFFATGDKNTGALSPCSIGTFLGLPPVPVFDAVGLNLFATVSQFWFQDPDFYWYGFTFNSEPAQILGTPNPLLGVFTFQVPCDIKPGPVSVSLGTSGDIGFGPVNHTFTTIVDIHSASPGIFEITMSDGVRRAVAVRPDGTFVSPQNSARRGEKITLYITGLGPTSPPLVTGALPPRGVDAVSTAA
jgi:hypothetical protein